MSPWPAVCKKNCRIEKKTENATPHKYVSILVLELYDLHSKDRRLMIIILIRFIPTKIQHWVFDSNANIWHRGQMFLISKNQNKMCSIVWMEKPTLFECTYYYFGQQQFRCICFCLWDILGPTIAHHFGYTQNLNMCENSKQTVQCYHQL